MQIISGEAFSVSCEWRLEFLYGDKACYEQEKKVIRVYDSKK